MIVCIFFYHSEEKKNTCKIYNFSKNKNRKKILTPKIFLYRLDAQNGCTIERFRNMNENSYIRFNRFQEYFEQERNK